MVKSESHEGGVMIDPQMERALLRFEPLPEDVGKRLIRLDC